MRLTFTDPQRGEGGTYEGRVERKPTLHTPAKTGQDDPYPFVQYAVRWCEQVGLRCLWWQYLARL